MKSINKIIRFLTTKVKAPTKIMNIKQVQSYWSDYSKQYNTFDYGPQTFFYTLAYMLQLKKANRILEVACGTGKLLPLVLQMKRKDTKYSAVDISPSMIQLANINLKNYFTTFSSKLTFEEWKNHQNLQVQVANAEIPIIKQTKFDRILCNCCLMLTSNPQKMLQSMYLSSSEDCLLGLSIWGDKNKNNLFTAIRESIIETGNQIPQERSNFHLYGKIEELLSRTGWQIIMSWEQNTPFPVLQLNINEQAGLLLHQVQKMPLNAQPQIKSKLIQKISFILQSKQSLNFSCQLIIARKKKQ